MGVGAYGFRSTKCTSRAAPRGAGRPGSLAAPRPRASRRPPAARPGPARPGTHLSAALPRAGAEPDKWYAMTRGMITLLLLVIIRVSAI